MYFKQVIVVRKDLGMRKGKMIAQGAHASLKVFHDRGFEITEDMKQWFDTGYRKICVGVNSEAELLNIVEQAREANIPFALVTDLGFTEFHGKETKTCCAIGPANGEEVDKITGGLRLL